MTETQKWLISQAAWSIPLLLGVIAILIGWVGIFVKKLFKDQDEKLTQLAKGLGDAKADHKKDHDALKAKIETAQDSLKTQIQGVQVQAIKIKDELKDEMHQIKDKVRDTELNVSKISINFDNAKKEFKDAFGKIVFLEKTSGRHENILGSIHRVMKNFKGRLDKVDPPVEPVKIPPGDKGKKSG